MDSANSSMGPALKQALKETSRSFWLSLRFLPPATRDPISLAYSLARLADTIADTDCVDLQERIVLLRAFQARLVDADAKDVFKLGELLHDENLSHGEKKLLGLAHTAFAALDRLKEVDAEPTRDVLKTLTDGMLHDARIFTTEGHVVKALRTEQQLDQYCYMVAGCVGKYWTDIHEAHLPAMKGVGAALRPLGIRLGKGLQLINILRDLPEDLENGRCYLPEQDLAQLGLEPSDLLHPGYEKKVMPLLHYLMDTCFEHLQAGREYLRRLPYGEFRLRLCTTWPLEIAMRTLDAMKQNPHPLSKEYRIKIPRRAVYQLMLRSLLRAPFPVK